jgi:hypothetical protein
VLCWRGRILGQGMLDFGCLGHIMFDFSKCPFQPVLETRRLGRSHYALLGHIMAENTKTVAKDTIIWPNGQLMVFFVCFFLIAGLRAPSMILAGPMRWA